jgi:hypothetical protein
MHLAMWPLLKFVTLLLRCIPAFFRSRNNQAIVELALRQQLACAFSESVSAPTSDIRVIRRQRSSRFSPRIAMVKAAYARQSDDLGARRRSILNRSAGRRVAETGMDPFSVVILDVLA